MWADGRRLAAAVGYILLVVGIVGALISVVFWSSWAGPGYFTRRERIVDDRY